MFTVIGNRALNAMAEGLFSNVTVNVFFPTLIFMCRFLSREAAVCANAWRPPTANVARSSAASVLFDRFMFATLFGPHPRRVRGQQRTRHHRNTATARCSQFLPVGPFGQSALPR